MKTFFAGAFRKQPIQDHSLWPDIPSCRSFESVIADAECLPYTCPDFSLFFFGDIYNGDELSKKHQITGTTVELAGQLYQKAGEASFPEYDGHCTIVVYEKDKTVIYRDFCNGGLPVYYSDKYFASSLKILTEIKGFPCNPNIESLARFLQLGYIPAPDTALLGVKKMKGGQMLTYAKDQITVRDMLSCEDFIKSHGTASLSLDDAVSEYDRLHRQAIGKCIAGAHSPGLLLSGGYDTGGNIIRLRDIYGGPVKTFSVGFKNSTLSELPLARLMAQRYDTEHFEYEIDGSEIAALPELIETMGDPFQESGMMINYLVMRMAAQHSPDIILGGDGNDQLFGSGARDSAWRYTFDKYGATPVLNVLNAACNEGIGDGNSSLFRRKFQINSIAGAMRSKCLGFDERQLRHLFRLPLQFSGISYFADFPRKFRSFEELYLSRNYLIDIDQTLRQIIIFKASQMARFFDLRAAFPYVSREMRQFLQTLPYTYKIRGTVEDLRKGKGISKYVQHASLKDKMPPESAEKTHQGGFAPLTLFFADPANREMYKNIILQSGVTSSVLDKKYVSGFLSYYDQFSAMPDKWYWQQHIEAFRYFNLLILALWWEIFILKRKGTVLNDFVLKSDVTQHAF